MATIVEINSPEQLDDYRLAWNALLAETPGSSFFHSLDWLQTYWNHFGGDQRLRVLIVYVDRRPVGILPLCIRTEKTRLGSVRTLAYPLDDWGAFYGPIGPNPTATLLAAMRHLRHSPRDWDVIDLRGVDGEQSDRGRTPRAMQQVGFKASETCWAEAAEIDCTGGWDAYWKSRRSHWRTNVRSILKKLRAAGRVSHIRFRPDGAAAGDDDPRWDLYDECERIAAASWQADAPIGNTLSHAGVRGFFRDAHFAAVARGAVDLNLLLLDGEGIAFAYNYVHQGRVFGLRSGFDARFASLGPGTALLYEAIRDSFARDDSLYDLGPNYLQCKRHWWTTVRPVLRYTHYPAGAPKAQALRLQRWTSSLFHRDRDDSQMAATSGKHSAAS